ncbi:acyl-CoA ligase (AMP-forming), exosortase A system-associated [Motiliproteus sediminis]|uniref:acyl-CoA ligase (AMP-forming), exosortase A system-associated n=1 Tax=Motiliproteus sediminis TaxID=1468178 RepID=UPI001AEFE923|nr:acyl-CoA ligase (AMP-forming), exosortase A system-associated [Motiliproteus sediminis]
MRYLFHHLLTDTASRQPDRTALVHKQRRLSYAQVAADVRAAAAGLTKIGLCRHQRVAVYLPKQPETVVSLFATSRAGGIFVPINPVLKAAQVEHIAQDCNVHLLITNAARATQLLPLLSRCADLRVLVLTDATTLKDAPAGLQVLHWDTLLAADSALPAEIATDNDLAAILYTSGSTGKPKGVMLSHRNLLCGADSVASYIGNHADDRIMAALPLSFDAGLSQVTTAMASGACCYLHDYLLPGDVLKLVRDQQITGLTAVPPLWHQIAALDWGDAGQSLRYFANTGGHMPAPLLARLRQSFPAARPYLMYGLTEAFRSTYLDPEEAATRPDSIGKAIPNAEILVLREDGSECEPNEVGELVHRGPLVSQGYWNDPARTAARFRPIPKALPGLVQQELAVWSGDSVRKDQDGFLYFVGRQDEMIKTSGYRVSPAEIEEVAYQSGLVGEAVALGISHPTLGQAVLLLVADGGDGEDLGKQLLAACRQALPGFMVPLACEVSSQPLPRNPNGKFDRKELADRYAGYFN